MSFNSIEFLVFAALFFSMWPMLRGGNNRRWALLTVASFIFYGWWDARFLLLIVGSGMIDYLAGLAMVRWPGRRKLWLGLSILGNVGSLAVFKYLDFGIGTLNALAGLVGLGTPVEPVGLILPVGISFYTFQSMSYTIDIYRGQLTPTRNPLHFFAYLSMFPQLVAGPIVRAADLLPQLAQSRPTTEAQRWQGAKLIAYGFFKKVVVADSIAPLVRNALSADEPLANCGYWWVIMLLFSYQIYCDFSGYSDIARGLGKWMGYEFPLNFNHPYIARGFRDFWARWHISLSTWFRDYVYIPLGGSRMGRWRVGGNLMVTMLVSGLWHGANWTFVVWGAVHGALLMGERVTGWTRRLARLPVVGPHLVAATVFAMGVVSWVFVTARDMGHAGQILSVMFDLSAADRIPAGWLDPTPLNLMGLMMLRQLWFHFRLDRDRRVEGRLRLWRRRWHGRLAEAAFVGVLLAACVFLRGPGSTFIYFQF